MSEEPAGIFKKEKENKLLMRHLCGETNFFQLHGQFITVPSAIYRGVNQKKKKEKKKERDTEKKTKSK